MFLYVLESVVGLFTENMCFQKVKHDNNYSPLKSENLMNTLHCTKFQYIGYQKKLFYVFIISTSFTFNATFKHFTNVGLCFEVIDIIRQQANKILDLHSPYLKQGSLMLIA